MPFCGRKRLIEINENEKGNKGNYAHYRTIGYAPATGRALPPDTGQGITGTARKVG